MTPGGVRRRGTTGGHARAQGILCAPCFRLRMQRVIGRCIRLLGNRESGSRSAILIGGPSNPLGANVE